MLNSVKKYIMKNISPHGSSALSPPNTSSQINYSVLWISLQIVHSFTDRFFFVCCFFYKWQHLCSALWFFSLVVHLADLST